MQAIVITQPGPPDVLALRDVPLPEPFADQVRVRVHATAVNRADLLQRMGRYPAPGGVPPGSSRVCTVASPVALRPSSASRRCRTTERSRA